MADSASNNVPVVIVGLLGSGDLKTLVRCAIRCGELNHPACVEEAEIEVSDPFVAHVECSELLNGKLTLSFRPGDGKPAVQSHAKAAGG